MSVENRTGSKTRTWLLSLSLVAAGVWLPLSAAEEDPQPGGDQPAPVGDGTEAEGEGDGEGLTEAERRLVQIQKELALLDQGAEAAAQFHYDQGLRAMSAGNGPKAIRHLIKAVDYFPENEVYQQALKDARVVFGVDVDPRGPQIDRVQQELNVHHQELMAEISRKVEAGKRHLERGEYNQAELAFESALVNLEGLPFADDRREAKMREVEQLLVETKRRRNEQELTERTQLNQQAAQRQRILRQQSIQHERESINMLLRRAMRARERRDYDEAILLAEQVLRINRTEARAHDLIVAARRERHVYLRQITADRWDEQHKLLSERIRSDMLPQLDLVQYSEDWASIAASRVAPSTGGGQTAPAWRTEIEESLSRHVDIHFDGVDILDVVTWLAENTGVNFVLDPNVVAQGATPPVVLHLQDVELRSALSYIMQGTGLTYRLQNEAVFITDDAMAGGDVVMRVYDIRDLTIGITQFPGPELTIPDPGSGSGASIIPPITDDADAPQSSDFIEIIETVVAPDSWQDNPNASIDEWNGSLVVNQTPEIHEQIEGLLDTLRGQQAVQINVKVRFLTVENTMLEEIGVNWNNFRGPPGWPGPNYADANGNPILRENTDGNGNLGPFAAGANPNTALTTPPWWFGGYWRDNDAENVGAGQVTNELIDPFTGSGLRNTGGFEGELQIFEDPEGFLGRAILKAVEKTRRGNVVIAPDLTLMSGQRANLVRMNQQSYIADFDVEGDQYDPIVEILSFGTVLDVEAIASANRQWITLTLRPTSTEVLNWRRFGGDLNDFGGIAVVNQSTDGDDLGAIAGQFPIMVPEMRYRAVRTSVTIPDGGSLLIAGFTSAQSARSHSGIPFLSHIPFLGRLFSRNGRSETEFKDLIYVEGNILIFDEIEERL